MKHDFDCLIQITTQSKLENFIERCSEFSQERINKDSFGAMMYVI